MNSEERVIEFKHQDFMSFEVENQKLIIELAKAIKELKQQLKEIK